MCTNCEILETPHTKTKQNKTNHLQPVHPGCQPDHFWNQLQPQQLGTLEGFPDGSFEVGKSTLTRLHLLEADHAKQGRRKLFPFACLLSLLLAKVIHPELRHPSTGY